VDFATALRHRRTAGRVSQLELAIKAGTTQRHLSFIESGRSAPGRDMVIRLAESLGLPLRERNELLLTAGYAPAYPETPLDSADLAPVMAALTHIIDAHMSYPAIIIDRRRDHRRERRTADPGRERGPSRAVERVPAGPAP
jgi:transcriptional regulator with XRE-family HTH domain